MTALSLISVSASASAQGPVRICPVGDSILESYDGKFTARYYLQALLEAGGYAFDFVGTHSGVYCGEPADPNFDQDHEAISGWRLDHQIATLQTRLAVTTPDIVLIHLGTNDVMSRHSVQSSIDELGECIDIARAVNPGVTVLVSQILPLHLRDVVPFNAEIPALVAAKDSLDSRVIVVDHFTPFDLDVHTTAGDIHPNNAGEQLMAQVWYSALLPFLAPLSSEPEQLTSGCAGNNAEALRLSASRGQALSVDHTFSMRVRSSPEGASLFGVIGFDDQDGVQSPVDLEPLGAPGGCVLFVSPDVVLPLSAHPSGQASWTLTVPANLGLIGKSAHVQVLALGPYNPLGVIVSDALKITVVPAE